MSWQRRKAVTGALQTRKSAISRRAIRRRVAIEINASPERVWAILIAGTALSVHGLIAAADALYQQSINPALVMPALQDPAIVDGENVDYFSYDNPLWLRIGVLALAEGKDGTQRKQLRMSFPSRRAIADELKRKLRVTTASP
jgi:hypothetical protein